jgi:hypothetical protein
MKPPKGVPAAEHKSRRREELGNITGRRGAGMTSVGGGDQLMHSFNYYGKDAPSLVTDMVGPPMGVSRSRIRGV